MWGKLILVEKWAYNENESYLLARVYKGGPRGLFTSRS